MIPAFAQVDISGLVVDSSDNAVVGANIYIEGTYDGCSSDEQGNFAIHTTETGEQTLIISSIGYESKEIKLFFDSDTCCFKIALNEQISELDEVVINAGTFEAGDKMKSVILSSIDVATTAGVSGDIYGAFSTLPGSQHVGEEGRIFVRGGEAYETKTYMDGMLVESPYYSQMPDLPARGRFSPLLFSGTVFSTGGYSAEYGQALSSIVALETTGLEEETSSSISLLTVGIQGSHAQRWENSSLAFSGELLSNGITNRVFKQNVQWLKDPVITDGTLMYRKKTGKSGLVKSFGSFNYNTSSLKYYNAEESIFQNITNTSSNSYMNTVYKNMLNDSWMIHAGTALNLDKDEILLDDDIINTSKWGNHTKLTFTNFTTDNITSKIGADYILSEYKQEIFLANAPYLLDFSNQITAAFIESEMKVSDILAFRIGMRAEQSFRLPEITWSPRFSAAAKTGHSSQLSFAFGKFFQNPEDDYLKFDNKLKQEESTHTILTWQYKKDSKILRIEAYNKKYSGLIRFIDEYSGEPGNYNNEGSGYSRGVDIFWRNNQLMDEGDYWISYSWNDSKRSYRDFPQMATPHYISAHNVSVVYKRYMTKLSCFAAVTYSFASGRPYYNPNNSAFMSHKTKPYNDISIGLTHIMQIHNKQAIIHLIVNNVFGMNNIYGYRYSSTPDENGIFGRTPVKPPSKRLAVLLISLEL